MALSRLRRPASAVDVTRSLSQDEDAARGVGPSGSSVKIPPSLIEGVTLLKIPENPASTADRRVFRLMRADDTIAFMRLLPQLDFVETAPHLSRDMSSSVEWRAAGANPFVLLYAKSGWHLVKPRIKALPLACVTDVVAGALSATFRRYALTGGPMFPDDQCFSVHCASRTLDCVALTPAERNTWVSTLTALASTRPRAALSTRIVNTASLAPVDVPSRKSVRFTPDEVPSAPSVDAFREDDMWSPADKGRYLQRTLFDSIQAKLLDDVVLALEDGVDLELRHPMSNDTPLLCACRVNATAIAKLFLERGAVFNPDGAGGTNALHAAVSGDSDACVELILDAGAATSRAATAYILSLADETQDGNTPLHTACARGNVVIINRLLEGSTHPLMSRNKAHRTPLHCLCAAAPSEQGPATKLDGALAALTSPRRLHTPGRMKKGTPAANRALEGTPTLSKPLTGNAWTEAARLILDVVDDDVLTWGDTDGNTPLHIAAARGALSIVQTLLFSTANPLVRSVVTGFTPRDLANSAGHVDVVRMLDEYVVAVKPQQAWSRTVKKVQARTGVDVAEVPHPTGADAKLPRAFSTPARTAAKAAVLPAAAVDGVELLAPRRALDAELAQVKVDAGSLGSASAVLDAVTGQGRLDVTSTAAAICNMCATLSEAGTITAPPWVVARDPAGVLYYFNTKDGQSQWHPPPALLKAMHAYMQTARTESISRGGAETTDALSAVMPRAAGVAPAAAPAAAAVVAPHEVHTTEVSTRTTDVRTGWQATELLMAAPTPGTLKPALRRSESSDGERPAQPAARRMAAAAPPQPTTQASAAPTVSALLKPVTAAPTAAGGAASADALSNPACDKYVKMLRTGVPLDPVLQRMRMDGVAADTAAAFEAAARAHVASGQSWHAPASATTTSVSGAAEGAVKRVEPAAAGGDDARAAALESVTSDPRFKKYVDMKRHGVPLGAIKGKMGMDGMSDSDANTFLSAYASATALQAMGIASPANKAAAASSDAAAVPLATTGAVGKPVMLKVHWDPLKLDEDAMRRSVWGQLSTAADAEPLSGLAGEDLELLETMFATKPAAPPPPPIVAASSHPAAGHDAAAGATSGSVPSTPTSGRSTPAASPAQRPKELKSLLDFKRANNVNISLAQFRKFGGHAAIVAAVYKLDAAVMSRDTLEKLAAVMPTPEEVRMYRDCGEDPEGLMECDRWFQLLARVPRFNVKVASFMALLSFDEVLEDTRSRAAALRSACERVMASERLRRIMGHVLTIGNVLNQGNARLEARAISLESLGKLPTTKGADKKTTLLDALVMLADRKGGEELLAFADDFAGLGDARRIEVSDLKGDITKLRSAAALAKQEADTEDTDAAPVVPGPRAPASTSAPASQARVALANMLAARVGGGVAPPRPEPVAAKASGAGMYEVDPALRAAFVARLREFASACSAALAGIDDTLRKTEAAAGDLAAYFGEDAKSTPPSKVFAALLSFGDAFRASATAWARKKAATARSARALVTAPAAAGH